MSEERQVAELEEAIGMAERLVEQLDAYVAAWPSGRVTWARGSAVTAIAGLRREIERIHKDVVRAAERERERVERQEQRTSDPFDRDLAERMGITVGELMRRRAQNRAAMDATSGGIEEQLAELARRGEVE